MDGDLALFKIAYNEGLPLLWVERRFRGELGLGYGFGACVV